MSESAAAASLSQAAMSQDAMSQGAMSSLGIQDTDWMPEPASRTTLHPALHPALHPVDRCNTDTPPGVPTAADTTLPLARNDAEVNADITALVQQYSSTLYRVAYSVTRNAAEAEDAVQETFLRVLRHQHQLGEIRDLRVWLVRIAWNVVLDRKRREKTRPENEDIDNVARLLTSSELRADERVIAAQRHARILRLIDKLPAREREVLLLSAFDEISTAQIAAILSTTESSVRSRLFRARKLLSALLRNDSASLTGTRL